jgi:hypothetical protein
MKVRQEAVEAIDHRRAGRAPRLVTRSEHEVVVEQLTAAVEQLRQRARALLGFEAVLLVDRDPWQLAPLPRQLVTQAGVLLFADEQLLRASAHSSRLTIL